MKYEFHVGDYVEKKDGRYGYITEIQRHTFQFHIIGLDPKLVVAQYPLYDSYSSYSDNFNRIGQYDFTKTEPKSIERLPVDLVARFEIPDGRYMTTKAWDKDGKFVEASYSRELIDKINELINVVNELQKDYNTHLETHKQNER